MLLQYGNLAVSLLVLLETALITNHLLDRVVFNQLQVPSELYCKNKLVFVLANSPGSDPSDVSPHGRMKID